MKRFAICDARFLIAFAISSLALPWWGWIGAFLAIGATDYCIDSHGRFDPFLPVWAKLAGAMIAINLAILGIVMLPADGIL